MKFGNSRGKYLALVVRSRALVKGMAGKKVIDILFNTPYIRTMRVRMHACMRFARLHAKKLTIMMVDNGNLKTKSFF